MNGRLASLLALFVAVALGFGAGRTLGAEEEPEVTATTTTTTTVPEAAPSPIADSGPTLSDLVPGLDGPILIETSDPTQLLRWDPDEPAPVPVRNLPAGTDLTMDRAGRFQFLAMPGGRGQLLLGGLADTPPALFSDRMSHFPEFAEFDDALWFLEGDEVVAVTTWGDEQFRGPWKPEPPEGVVIDFESGPILEAADDSGAVIFWYYLPVDGEVVFARFFVSADGTIDLPSEPDTQVAGFNETHVLLRDDIGALVQVDKATGETSDVAYDGSCGRTLVNDDGIRASVCRGVAIILTDTPIIDTGSWNTGRWSATGQWFMATSGQQGKVLLIDMTTRIAHEIEVPVALQTTVVDIWSGA
jgi:hypothetical protein